MKQYEAVLITLEKLGGVATLAQLNANVFHIKDCAWKTKTPFASIRRIVQQAKGIYKIKPGLYGLEKMKSSHVAQGIVADGVKGFDSIAAKTFSHTYYQSLLLDIGRMRHLGTFVPNQDKNKKAHDGRSLGDISTINEIPLYSYDKIVKRSSTVDVIWFNERQMPDSFFEVEHSTDIQNSLLKFLDLQDLFARMIIVADKKRKQEFVSKLGYSAFDKLASAKRVRFLDYDALIKQYEQEVERLTFECVL